MSVYADLSEAAQYLFGAATDANMRTIRKMIRTGHLRALDNGVRRTWVRWDDLRKFGDDDD